MRDNLRTRGGLAALVVALAALNSIPADAASTKAADILARLSPPSGPLDPLLAALSAGTITADIAPLRPGQVVPDPVSHGYVIQGSELAGFDVTATAEGQAEGALYRVQLAERGEPIPTTVRVFSLPDITGLVPSISVINPDDIDPDDATHALPIDTGPVDALSEDEGPLSSSLVVPGCVTPELVGAVVQPAGDIYVKTMFASTAGFGCPGADVDVDVVGGTQLDGVAGQNPGDEDQWTPAGGIGCPKRKQNDTAWFDVCSWWYHRTNDGISGRDTYGLKQYGTGKSKNLWRLDTLEVQSWRKKGTPDQDWVDWSPRSDADYGHCSTDTIGVNVNAAYLEHSDTHCETWDIAKGSEPADFANRWRGDVRRSERDTASIIATNVPDGYYPTDYHDFDYNAHYGP